MSDLPQSRNKQRTPSCDQRIVDDFGKCSLCGGTHYGTGWYRCPFACQQCPGGFNVEPCNKTDCGRKP